MIETDKNKQTNQKISDSDKRKQGNKLESDWKWRRDCLRKGGRKILLEGETFERRWNEARKPATKI